MGGGARGGVRGGGGEGGNVSGGGSWSGITSVSDFGDFGVSFVATVAGRYTRLGVPRLVVVVVLSGCGSRSGSGSGSCSGSCSGGGGSGGSMLREVQRVVMPVVGGRLEERWW